MPPTVVVNNLRKRYGPIAAADGVSFDVQRGEIFGLLGPNGAGKTTTVECLVGLRQPDEGTIEICGIDARRRPRDAKQRVGAALQTTALQDRITPREALDLFASFYAQPAAADELLERFGLVESAARPFATLSGGQKQRLALALAFINNPEVVVLDEPTAGLDPQVRRDLRTEIARMRDDGRTVLLTTHDLDEAEQLCDRVAIIDRGQIVVTGSPGELTSASNAMPTVAVSTVPPLAPGWLGGLHDVHALTYDAFGARFRTTHLADALSAVVSSATALGAEIAELHVQKATLEDIVIERTGSGRGR
jgi:ABC-2 type transport system ATP-binding protein